MDWLHNVVNSNFQSFWTTNGFSCIHILSCSSELVQENTKFPVQRDGHGCAFYAAKTVLDVIVNISKNHTTRICNNTFDPLNYTLESFMNVRKYIYEKLEYQDASGKYYYLHKNICLKEYLISIGMFSIEEFSSPSTYQIFLYFIKS